MNTAALYLKRGISAEYLKLKGTLSVWFALLGPLIPVSFMFTALFFKGEDILKDETVAWDAWLKLNFEFGMFLLVPFFLMLINTLVNQLDYKNNTHKLLYSFSIPKGSLYFSRVLMVIGLYTLFFALFMGLMYAGGNLLGFVKPELGFAEGVTSAESWFRIVRAFLGGFGLLSIQFVLSFRWRNPILPIGLGTVLLFASYIGSDWSYALYSPYLYINLATEQTNDFGIFFSHLINDYVIMSLSVFIVTLLGGYFTSRHRDIL